MKIEIDQNKCLRCGMCTGIAMDIFDFDDDGNIHVNEENINDDTMESVEDAINSCPVGAIEKKEDKEE
jgi:ferredoxin